MSIASPTLPPDIDLDALIQSLPACKRCRECRRGCDTLLPKCRQCTKAGVECSFYDHGKDELLPRSYIAKLIDHVHKLKAHANPSPAASGPTPQDPAASTPTSVVKNEFFKSDSVVSEPLVHPVQPEHFFAEAAGSYRYLGAEACLVKSPRQKAKELNWGVGDEDDDEWRISIQQSDAKNHELVEVYIEQIQALYPILDVSARYLASELPSDLTAVELFHLNMIYSIGCHVTPLILSKKVRQREGFGKIGNPSDDRLWSRTGRHTYRMAHTQNYTLLAQNFLETAELYMEAATADATVEGLRAILLLAINSLFDPLRGNIGQQIAIATRLALALEQKSHDMSPSDLDMVHRMHTTIFSLENEIATVLDRPATFPEPEGELCFDLNRPADYFCSIYRLQNRWRKGNAATKAWALNQLPPLDLKYKLPPSLRLILHQTRLLFDPVWQTAWQVLEAVVETGSIHIYLTPHWVYRAATVVMKENWGGFHPEDVITLYSNALVVLQISSWKWGSAAALAGSLENLMQQKRLKTTGDLWDKTHTVYDIQIPQMQSGLPST
ncbi:hypothetical protein DPSP01_003604 [Paraphaeosphaeria sporulosa]